MSKPKYQCKKCGHKGNKFIFQFDGYTYCIATNNYEPELLSTNLPKWVNEHNWSDYEIEDPVGCPKCHCWGVPNFERID